MHAVNSHPVRVHTTRMRGYNTNVFPLHSRSKKKCFSNALRYTLVVLEML